MLVDGKAIAREIIEDVKSEVFRLGIMPFLAVILVGEDPASLIYIKNKRKACKQAGIESMLNVFSVDVEEEVILHHIRSFNNDPKVHGILIQLPLPEHLNKSKIFNTIDPKKDVDCFHCENIGKLFQDAPEIESCTPAAVLKVLEKHCVELKGKHVVIINDSFLIGKPLSIMLLQRNATVTVCNKYTDNLKSLTLMADIVVTAVGKRDVFTLTKDMIKTGSVIIDLGITRQETILGDVDDNVREKASLVAAVPGGCGKVTISLLLRNTLKCAKLLQ